jgi:cytochrome c551/c552
MKIQRFAFLGVLICLALPAHADLALADKSACLNCHDVAKKMVGPAFKTISDKYKGRADASTYLAEKITKGGSGVWGSIPMPGMPQVAAADVKTLAEWIAKGAN